MRAGTTQRSGVGHGARRVHAHAPCPAFGGQWRGWQEAACTRLKRWLLAALRVGKGAKQRPNGTQCP